MTFEKSQKASVVTGWEPLAELRLIGLYLRAVLRLLWLWADEYINL